MANTGDICFCHCPLAKVELEHSAECHTSGEPKTPQSRNTEAYIASKKKNTRFDNKLVQIRNTGKHHLWSIIIRNKRSLSRWRRKVLIAHSTSTFIEISRQENKLIFFTQNNHHTLSANYKSIKVETYILTPSPLWRQSEPFILRYPQMPLHYGLPERLESTQIVPSHCYRQISNSDVECTP